MKLPAEQNRLPSSSGNLQIEPSFKQPSSLEHEQPGLNHNQIRKRTDGVLRQTPFLVYCFYFLSQHLNCFFSLLLQSLKSKLSVLKALTQYRGSNGCKEEPCQLHKRPSDVTSTAPCNCTPRCSLRSIAKGLISDTDSYRCSNLINPHGAHASCCFLVAENSLT